MKRGCLVALAVPAVLGLVLVGAFAVPMIRNNLALDEWKSMLYDVPPPDGAEVVDTGTEFGLLVGNGNHCDFLAWVTLRTEQGSEAVEAHYEDHLGDGGFVTASTTGPELVRVEWFDLRTAGWDLRCH